MTTGEHEHCFCRLNTAGQPMCCKCGTYIGAAVINLEELLIRYQAKHAREEQERKAKEKEGR